MKLYPKRFYAAVVFFINKKVVKTYITKIRLKAFNADIRYSRNKSLPNRLHGNATTTFQYLEYGFVEC